MRKYTQRIAILLMVTSALAMNIAGCNHSSRSLMNTTEGNPPEAQNIK